MSRRQPRSRLTVGRALLVAGPPTAGKSTFIRSMRRGNAGKVLPPQVRDVETWVYATLTGIPDLARVHGGRVPNLVLHVDISQLTLSRGRRLSQLEKVLHATDELHVITLWAPAEVLLTRLCIRQLERSLAANRDADISQQPGRAQRKRELLADAASLDRLYEQWAAFQSGLPVTSSRVVDSSTRRLVVT